MDSVFKRRTFLNDEFIRIKKLINLRGFDKINLDIVRTTISWMKEMDVRCVFSLHYILRVNNNSMNTN